MRKLIINGLLLIAVLCVIIAIIWGFSRLRAVDEKDQQVQESTEQLAQDLTEEKTVVQQTQVKVNVNASKNTTNTSTTTKTAAKPATSDEDVNDFWNSVG